MPDTFTETLRAVALNIGVPALIVFWYACRVRHPARPRWQAFLMALAVLATRPGGDPRGAALRDHRPRRLPAHPHPRRDRASLRASRHRAGLASQRAAPTGDRSRAGGRVPGRSGVNRAGGVTRRAGAPAENERRSR